MKPQSIKGMILKHFRLVYSSNISDVVSSSKYFMFQPHPKLSNLVTAQADMLFPTDELPSLCPPVPFTSPTQGGNFLNTGIYNLPKQH